MAVTSRENAPRSKRALWVPLLIWSIFAFALHFAAPLLNGVRILGFPLAYYLAAQGALIIFAMLGFWVALPWRGAPRANIAPLFVGMSTAGLWMSGAAPVALIGALYAYGYDGLAFALGLTGGFVLVGCVVAPAFARAQSASLEDFLAKRTGGIAAPYAATAMLLVCLTLLVSAEFEVVRRLVSPLFANTRFTDASGALGEAWVLVLPVIMATIIAVIQTRVTLSLQAVSYVAILCLVGGAAALMSLVAFDIAIPQLAYGHGLQDLAVLERSLILDGLSDPAVVQPFAKSNNSFSAENFAALSISLMLGAAVAPHLLTRISSSGPDPIARQASAWSLFFVVLLVITLPAIATLTKLDIYSSIARGMTMSSVPNWLEQSAYSTTPPLCAHECAEPGGRLHVQDVTIDPEAILPSVAAISRLPEALSWLLIGALAVAALLCAGSMIAVMAGALRFVLSAPETEGGEQPNRKSALVRAALTVPLAVIAGVVAGQLQADLITRIAWALSLAASGLFPMILLAAISPRANSIALAVGGITGFAVALYYIVGTQNFPVQFLGLWHEVSNMPPWRLEAFEEVRQNCRDAVPGACAEAQTMARELANWWGIDTRAVGIIGAPIGFVVACLVSLPTQLLRRATV
ncbi:cation/acetate symporter [Filomicrobium insigne]|uniref:Cation/acetate symporter n=1 Tax=Filomicrobium insigne TaxID=418854 RepID=A0A1H0IVX8_9HYPH|nr:sodium/substrate symporter small subunit [Filomicrobium insigne]SDO35595.1 cation/acetate symporter [Filomicrobium insigne]